MKRYLLLFFLLLSFSGWSQKYHFISYSLEQGLAQSQVVDIIEDADGFLWIGTRGGLSKFNGLEFQNFSKKDGLISNQISTLFLDKQNRMWVGADGGFSYFQNNTIKTVYFEEKYNSFKVNEFLEWGDTLLLATNGGGVLKYFDGKFEQFDELAPLENENIRSIALVGNELWMGSRSGLFNYSEDGLSQISINNVTEINVSDIAVSNQLVAVATYGQGLLVKNFETEKWSFYNESNGLVSNMLRSTYTDDSETVWVTSKFGFSKIFQKQITSFNEKNGLPHNNTTCLWRDIEGNTWLGSDGKGLHMFTGEAFVSYTEEDGLSSDFVMSILQDENRNLWFSTYGGGITKWSDGKAEVFGIEEGLPNSTVWTSLKDKNGNLWFGTSSGLSVRKKCKLEKSCPEISDFILYTIENALASNKVTALYEDDEQNIWVGTSRGISVILNGSDSIQNFVSGEKFPGVNVRAIESFDGKMWMGIQTGLLSFDGDQFFLIPLTKNEEEPPTVYCLHQHNNTLWIGSNSGLYFYQKGEVNKLDLDDNFNANTVNFIVNDESGNLWVGTNNGVYEVIGTQNEGFTIKHYTTLDGLKSLETNLNAAFKDDMGYLWMGTGGGLIRYNPYQDKNQSEFLLPRLHLTGLKLFMEDFDFGKYSDSVNPDNLLPENLELPYNKNYLSFNFIGISFKNSGAVRYKYKLEGFDESWTPATKSTLATYSNIPPGEYRFAVVTSKDEVNWSEPAYFSFIIHPPFWNTWWFYLLMVFLVITSVYLIVMFRVRTIERKKENEKLTFQSKLIALEQQSLNASMNRHFIFNSLNSIQYFINVSDKRSANKYLTNFAKLIRKNLDSSTAENYMVDLSEELERVELYLTLESMRFQDQFGYQIKVAENIETESFKVPSMMLQPFIENSIIHGVLPKEGGGKILIEIKKDDSYLWVYIIDDGVGIENSMTQKDESVGDHLSKGMMITSGRVALLSKLTAKDVSIIGPKQNDQNSVFNTGTTVIVKFPY